MNGDMALDELHSHANEMCRQHWGVDYTDKIILVNREWRSMNGCLRTRKDGSMSPEIRLSRKTNEKRTRDEVLGTLLHELVHWRLHVLGVPNHDTDREFIEECIRVGAPFSKARNAQEAVDRYLGIEAASHLE